MQLLVEHRLDARLLQQVEVQRLNSSTEALDANTALVEEGCNLLHAIYAEIYLAFHQLWLERNPSDIMAFPQIFNEVKLSWFRNYPSYREDAQIFA